MPKKHQVELLVATSNEGKLREIQQALVDIPLRLRYLKDYPSLHAVDEVGSSYEENATLKAVSYSNQTGVCTIADDSGLEVTALGGLPGIHSARYGGVENSQSMRNQMLLSALAKVRLPNRTARFVSVIVLAQPIVGPKGIDTGEPRLLKIASGRCEGHIACSPRGTHGFGYDPIFVPQGYQETFGELSEDVKSRISHRAKALLELRTFLMSW